MLTWKNGHGPLLNISRSHVSVVSLTSTPAAMRRISGLTGVLRIRKICLSAMPDFCFIGLIYAGRYRTSTTGNVSAQMLMAEPILNSLFCSLCSMETMGDSVPCADASRCVFELQRHHQARPIVPEIGVLHTIDPPTFWCSGT